mmetsp:Transcript_2825/g.4270  ORF Transcript_2825/g.4270 Transcript_2825/m.4270 type:complete len:506 (-) Transcript_2825:74-1591(-)|eukprot:CAMPEP_0197243534 /NCGR_PEP_ID=MMETSP1429-20130617/8959_1 /TAXON_ID=49237 /ORGANISM="Chaetoceros  sp., Strain UNC1202" /LENGTH=505 /DNA_ID=CAMNT_0042703773 /DNA_START=32 /DNA_END=1549 /DNA_ORIENTATION=+
MSSEATPSTDEAPTATTTRRSAASSARARAEARRKRILEQGKNRIEVINGTVPAKIPEADATSTEKPESTESEFIDAGNTKESTGTLDAASTETPSDAASTENPSAAPTKMSTSARVQQMRRRRYKKAAENAALKEESNAEGATTESGDASAKEETKVAPEAEVEKSTPMGTDESMGEEAGQKKKYMGVAKMRRKRLAEKKAQADKADAEEMDSATKDGQLRAISAPKPVALGQILVQLVTALLLFLTGFDVGVQNHVVVKQEVPNVHTNLSYIDHGIGAVFKFSGDKESTEGGGIIDLNESTVAETEEDEFGGSNEPKPAGATTDTVQEANIDPVFGVDFDKLIAGDGIFFAAARFAVLIHRSLTYFFYTLPLTTIHNIFAAPKRLFTNPPVLFLCAIIIRYFGKHVFGGSIPLLDVMIEAQVTDPASNGEKKGGLESIASADFLSMGKNFVSNFAKNNFPKVVMAFTVLKDARADMFVVLCGFFVGLIVPVGIMGVQSVSDEL